LLAPTPWIVPARQRIVNKINITHNSPAASRGQQAHGQVEYDHICLTSATLVRSNPDPTKPSLNPHNPPLVNTKPTPPPLVNPKPNPYYSPAACSGQQAYGQVEYYHVESARAVHVVSKCSDDGAAGGHNQISDVEHLRVRVTKRVREKE
jgi:hypothetical protein